MEELFLPVLHSFENNNVFTGSYGALRFKVTPAITMKNPKEVDMEASSMLCELWHGPFCYEKSEMEAQETFPLSEEGKENMRQFLLSHVWRNAREESRAFLREGLSIKGEHDRIKENCRCGRKKELATWNERALPTKPMWRF